MIKLHIIGKRVNLLHGRCVRHTLQGGSGWWEGWGWGWGRWGWALSSPPGCGVGCRVSTGVVAPVMPNELILSCTMSWRIKWLDWRTVWQGTIIIIETGKEWRDLVTVMTNKRMAKLDKLLNNDKKDCHQHGEQMITLNHVDRWRMLRFKHQLVNNVKI